MARPLLVLVLLCVAVQVILAADASARRSRHLVRAEATVVNKRVLDRVWLGVHNSSEPVLKELPDVSEPTLQVYYLEAPLFKAKYGNAGAAFNLFHGGVGFCVGEEGKCTKEFAVEYNAKNGVFSTLFPILEGGDVKYNDDKTSAIWANEAEQVPLDKIDMSYWTSKRRVATIDNALYKKVRDFIQNDLKQFPRYKLFYVKGPGDEVHSESSTCVDFVWRVLGFLAKNGVCLKQAVGADIPKRDYVVLYNTKPKTVLPVGPNRAKISSFYKKSSKHLSAVKNEVERISAAKDQDVRTMRKTVVSAVSKLSTAVKKMSNPNGLFYIYEDEKNVQEIQLKLSESSPVKLEYEHQTGKSYSPFADVENNCK